MPKYYSDLFIKSGKFISGKIKAPFSLLFHRFRNEIFRKSPYHMKYFGFNLYYKKGDGGINHLARGYSYEPDVIEAIIKNIRPNSTIIDVGSNIGLITLSVLHYYPTAHFHCFEPSGYSNQIFQQTILKNNLNSNIRLIKKGLYHKSGIIPFYTHGIPNALGDGIKDTKRAGISKKAPIEVTTLDNYVKKSKIQKIDLIKIDVEGAELFVLKGGRKSILKYRPLILFEANPVNLQAYNLIPGDIYHFFSKIDYKIISLSGEILDLEKFVTMTQKVDNYLASPI